MTRLPQGWCTAKIGDLCDLINGKAFKPSDWCEIGFPIVRIQNLNNTEAPFNYFDGEVQQRFLIDEGQLLFAWSGTPGTSFGAHIWKGGKAVLNQHIFKIEFNESNLDKHYFRYAINQNLQCLINLAHGGVGLRHITKGKFESTEIALPPLNEQNRIVAKLERLFERTRRAREELSHIPRLIENYKKAILAAAFRGDLTKDWREKRGLPMPEEVRLGEVAKKLSYGTSAKSSKSGDVPVLRMGNIQNMRIDWKDLVYTSDVEEIEKYSLNAGDVLFNRTNSPELVGKTAIYKGERPAIYAGYLIKIKCGNRLVPEYLNYCLNSPLGRSYCWRVKSDGVSQSNINAKKLADFSFFLPTHDEQKEIVFRIEKTLDWLDSLAIEERQASHLLDHLDQANLAKAFRGELVPQDPNDESASVLLDRIRTERAGQ